jgi:hypothetical protein
LKSVQFGARLGEVVQVQPEADNSLSVEAVEKLLAPVMPALKGLGGSVKVNSVDSATGAVFLSYSGPEKLVYGIELTLMDSELINEVKFD